MYYTAMTQPKAPPLSIRPGAERLALIEAYAKRRGITRHAAVLEMLDTGLSWGGPSRKVEIKAVAGKGVRKIVAAPSPKPWSGGHPKPGKGKR